MIGVDTNILIYAHREDSPFHEQADMVLENLVEGPGTWAIPWPCLYEFVAIATHPRIYDPPTSIEDALRQVDSWLESSALRLIGERGSASWDALRPLLERGRIVGPRVHDARIAAICQEHRVNPLYTADRDFSRFPELKTRNPLHQH